MHPISKLAAFASLAAIASTALAATGTITGVKFVSTPGDWVGQGEKQTFRPPTATITTNGATASYVEVGVTDTAGDWYTLDFAAPTGVALAHNSFPDAARYPFQSPMGAGLSVEGDGRGCNTVKGWFRVREYKLGASGEVEKLAIDFLQNCEVTDPPLYGVVRINSDLGLTVPESVAIAGPDFAVVSGQTATLDGTQSFTRKAAPLTYSWTQVSGPAVTLANPTSATPSFVAPAVTTATASLGFQLTTTDASGVVSTDTVVVIDQNASSPRTSLDFHGDPGDYISLGQAWHYDTYDSVITVSTNYDHGVSAAVDGDTFWNLDTAAPSGTKYQPGVYSGAQRFPFQSAKAPGLSLYGDGRGCNTVTGQFTVYQVQFDTSGNPTMADIGFTQHCEGGTPASYGELLFNAVSHETLASQLRAARQELPRQ